MQKVNILIPAAGEGSRFRNVGWHKPKPLIDVAGKPMIQIVHNNVKHWYDGSDRFICIVRRDSPPMPFECMTVVCDKLTEGAACTTLLAKELINNDDPLLIANSDQFLEWDRERFWGDVISDEKSDGIVVCFEHPMSLNDTKWSYARIDDETKEIQEIQEKKVISPYATVGLYYWRRGRDYVKYAEQMIAKNIRVNNEFYVAPVYNEAIQDGLKFKLHFCNKFWGLGTPTDLTQFLCDYIRPRNHKCRLIAHRGNTQGPNPAEENKPEYLQKALDQGFQVETDVWYKDGDYYLGHDEPQYKTTIKFLENDHIWKHCKTVETLAKLLDEDDGLGVCGDSFFHQNDDVTLTSFDSLWTYPDKPTFGSNAVAVLPTNPHKMMRDNPELSGLCLDDMSQVLATKIKAIVFDLDGVLVDSRDMHYEALNEALAKVAGKDFVISRGEHETTYDGLSTQQKLELLVTEKKLDPSLKPTIFKLKQEGTTDRFKSIQPSPDLREMLKEWKRRGFPIAVASNCIRSSVMALLTALGVLDQIDVIFSNEDVSKPKPDPEIYVKTAAAFGCTPQETLVVEDSKRGIAAATAAGARVFVVDKPEHLKFDVMQEFLCMDPETSDLERIYQGVTATNLQWFQESNGGSPDPALLFKIDNRRCFALYHLCNKKTSWTPEPAFGTLLGTLRQLLPDHIVYERDAGLHFTLMQMVGFRTNGCTFLREDEAKRAVEKYVTRFQIRFHSLAVTPKSIMVLGTPTGLDVNRAREMLRKALGSALEEPYKNDIVHMSVARFTRHLTKEQVDAISNLIMNQTRKPLGTLTVDHLVMSQASWRMLPEELLHHPKLIIPLH